MANTRYTEKDHERAFKLWRQGLSLREIAEKENMPSRETVRKWSKPDYSCDCKWHGYKALHNEIVSDALENIEKDMPDLVEQEEKRLKFLYGIEQEITEIMRAGELEPPKTYAKAVDILSELYNERRLIEGKSTEIQEHRGKSQGTSLNLNKIAKQLNVDNFQEVVHAAEEAQLAGDGDEE